MDTTKKKRIIAVGVAVLVLLFLWVIFFRQSPVTVETATATRGPLIVSIGGEGKTRFRDKIVVTAPVSGKMSRIKIREGDFIPRDFVITDIDPNPPQPRPTGEAQNWLNPSASKVYAPMSGRVLRISQKDERIIPAGTPIIELGNPDTVEIVIDLLSTDALQVRAGSVVLIDSEDGAEPVNARVRVVEPQAFTKISALGVEEQRVNVIADIQTKSLQFGDNFRVNAQIVVWRGEQILKIPSSALFRFDEKWSVFAVVSGDANRREVAVGRQTPSETEILEGVGEGETVILHPPNQLSDGASVTTR